MPGPRVKHISCGGAAVAIAGDRLTEVLSTDLFREQVGFPHGLSPRDLVVACHDRWTDLANTIAALPQPLDLLLFVGAGLDRERFHGGLAVAFLALGYGATSDEAEERSLAGLAAVRALLLTNLDFARLDPIRDEVLLEAVARAVDAPCLLELHRRREGLVVGERGLHPRSIGFDTDRGEGVGCTRERPCCRGSSLDHIYPWLPSDDSWRRLFEALEAEQQEVSLLIRVRGFDPAPRTCRDDALAMLTRAEELAAVPTTPGASASGLLVRQIQILRDAAIRRFAATEGRVLAIRVFVASVEPIEGATLATLLASIDDASVHTDQLGPDQLLFGGADVHPAERAAVLQPLDSPRLVEIFGLREAPAVLRTPMPQDLELPGVGITRARTAAYVGRSGDDIPLGACVHRGRSQPAALGASERFRHTYIVGQTGTGKSTLLAHMVLSDVARGRGVAVLDPHGSLIDDVLQRIPRDRVDDVVVVDLTDEEHPVPFNVLAIAEQDPERYRFARDMIIDDLYAFLDQTYDMKLVGGPMFESHFRAMLGLLMGVEPRHPPATPNLAVFRSLYTNRDLRKRLSREVRGRDVVLDEFLAEAEAAQRDLSLSEMAPYVSSKFARFVSDVRLRRITCQQTCLDLDAIVNEGKILLFHLGRGRFGDQAAGLLASQVVSRIRYAVLKRGAHRDARPFYLYADEFQLFADKRFAELMAEARKFGLSLTLAHQYAEQLPEQVLRSVLGNVGTVIALRVGARDAELFEPTFYPTFSRRDLVSQANFRACVRSFGVLGPMPFSVELAPPAPGAKPELADALRDLSRHKYGRRSEIVEDEFRETYEAFKQGGRSGETPATS